MIGALLVVALLGADLNTGVNTAVGSTAAAAELLRGQAGGMSHAVTSAEFYRQFSTSMSGNWWFLHGDGTSQAGAPIAVTAAGAPVANTVPTQGGTATTRYLDSTANNYYDTASYPSQVAGFSVGFWGAVDSNAGVVKFLDKVGGSNNNAWSLDNINASSHRFLVFKTDASSTSVSSSLMNARSMRFIVATYQFVTDGTSQLRLYVDGVLGGTSNTAVGPIQNASSAARVGKQLSGTAYPLTGNVGMAFYTEQVLDQAAVTAMSAALNPALTNDRGVAASITRTTPASYYRADGRVVVVPNSIPRVVDGKLLVQGAASNILSGDPLAINGAGWVLSTVNPTVTLKHAFGPDGSLTADRLVLAAVTGSGGSYTRSAFSVTNGTAYTVSFYARATSGTATMPYFLYNGAASLPLQTAALTETWQKITYTFTAAATASGFVFIGNEYANTTTDSVAADVLIWNPRVVTGPIANGDFGPASATRNSDVITVPTTGWPTSAGTIQFNYTHGYDGNPPSDVYFFDGGGWVAGTNGITALLQIDGAMIVRSKAASVITSVTASVATWTQGQTYRMRVKWGGGVVTVFRDDVVLGNGSSQSVPLGWHTSFWLGSSTGTTNFVNGRISDFKVIP